VLDHLIGSVIVAPLVGVLVTRLLLDQLRPRAAALAFTAAGLLLAGASTLSLAAAAAPAVAGLVEFASGGRWSDQSWLAVVSPRWVSWVSLAAVVVVAVSVGIAAWRQWRALRAARAQAVLLPGDAEVVILPDGHVDAFALPGLPGRVVVTEGMLAALGPAQHPALFAHERAHLAARHHRFAFAVRLAAAAHPGLRPLVSMVDYAIERWADELAAAEVGDRRSVAHVIGAAALASTRPVDSPGPLALRVGFPRRRGPRPGPVPRRIAALLLPPPGRRHLLLFLPVVLAAASCGLAFEALVDLPYREPLGLSTPWCPDSK